MTEKQYAPTKTEKKMTQKPAEVPAVKPIEKKTEIKKEETQKAEDKKIEISEQVQGSSAKNVERKKKTEAPKKKKDFAVVNAQSVPISTKYAISICKFIKRKTIADARRDLEKVLIFKKVVPMKGEYGHKKGEGKFSSGAGRYPKKATEHFIILLKSLAANSIANGLDEPVISEAIANLASRPVGGSGRIKRKRTHVFIKAVEKKQNNKTKNKFGGKK